MAPSLRISAGKDVASLEVIEVNSTEPHRLTSDAFEGLVAVRIKNFTGQAPAGKEAKKDSVYFDNGHAQGCTWSIQIQGRFKQEASVDDVEFGNKFDHAIRDKLPWGTSAALKAVSYIDPSLRQDIYADEPWAFSPLVCTMTRIQVDRIAAADSSSSDWPKFPQGGPSAEDDYVHDDTSALLAARDNVAHVEPSLEADAIADLGTLRSLRGHADANAHHNRARFFGDASHRERLSYTPTDVVTADFANGFIDFNTLRLELPYTGGMGFDLTRYWDGQPVRYYCRNKKTGTVYFVVEFQIAEKDS